MIAVPYWWNREADTLAATIHKVRSDLISSPPAAEPITLLCPNDDEEKMDPPLSHAFTWNQSQDVTGW